MFAAGDVATLIETPRPKSGVYAVRAAAPLADNLIAALAAQPLSTFTPQRRALYLLSTGPKHAIASWGPWALAGRWVWRWKNRIDRDYIAKLSVQPTESAMRALAILAFVFLILPLLLLAAGQFGLLKGRPPTEPGTA